MKKKKKFSYYLIVLICVLPLIISISFVQAKLNNIIVKEKLTDTDPVKNAPPLVAFTTIALGSFRGLVADILWLRSSALQDQGRYYEMVQLASWIVKLQPRFTGATAYLAWNMAYNISVTCSSFKDRWRWVQQGIELIRNEALDYNPGDPELYKELGWIFQHKIGNIMDDANIYYKNQWAMQLTKVLGNANPNWQELASAPETDSSLLKQLIMDKKWPGLLKKLDETKYKSISSLKTIRDIEAAFRIDGELPKDVVDKLTPQEAAYLTNFYRAHWLRTFYKMYPKEIMAINDKYGELDWRLPESQAIYWATLGIKYSKNKQDLSCERMISQSLKDSFMAGRLLIMDKEGYKNILTIPNLNVVDSVREGYLHAYEISKQKSFKSALENFMKDAIVNLFTYGRYSKAKEYYKLLLKDHPNTKRYRVGGLEQFVLKEWKEDVKEATPKQAYGIITGIFFRSYFFLAQGEYDSYEGYQKLGTFIYNYYKSENEDTWERVGLPPLNDTKKKIIDGCLKSFSPTLAKNLKFALDQQKEEKEKIK